MSAYHQCPWRRYADNRMALDEGISDPTGRARMEMGVIEAMEEIREGQARCQADECRVEVEQ